MSSPGAEADPVDLTADDWERTPWTYPGTPAPHGGLLRDGEFLPLAPGPGRLGDAGVDDGTLDDALKAAGVAGVDERRLVVAVGSNASPAVMARKLAAGEVSATLPFVAVVVHALAVGHSAHVSRRGFFAAAPFLDQQVLTRTYASLLDAEQLLALDRTEPNYVRRTVGAQTCAVVVDGGDRPSSFMVYDSRWGVLGKPGHDRWTLLPQEELFALLLDKCSAFAESVAPYTELRSAMRELAADPYLRTRVRTMLQEDGWAGPSGLVSGQSAG